MTVTFRHFANVRDRLNRQLGAHCGPWGFSQADVNAILAAWMYHRGPSSRGLTSAVAQFLLWGHSPAEVAKWMALGYDARLAEHFGRSLLASPEQASWARRYISLPGEISFAHSSHPCCVDVPRGLMRLIFAAGCSSVADFDDHIQEWHSGKDVESYLRFLALLRGVRMPAPDAPPLYLHEAAGTPHCDALSANRRS